MIGSPTHEVHPVFEIVHGQIEVWEREIRQLTFDPQAIDVLSFALENLSFWENRLAALKKDMLN